MDLLDKFTRLSELREALFGSGRNPFGVCMDDVRSATEAVIDGRPVILAGTNNYLGLTFDAGCVAEAQAALAAEGTGTTGSRIANGTYAAHRALERELAEFFGVRLAVVFSTGYQANLGVLAGLTGADDVLMIDADSHASIYDGCRLSGATVIRFKHNDPDDLAARLARLEPPRSNVLIVVEGIYSMFGDRAPLAEIAAVKREHGAYLVVDEAHSLGVLGERGRGLAEEAGVEDDVDFVVGTFSKSLGAVGGFCATDHAVFEMVKVSTRPFMYTASLPSSVIASVRGALARLRSDPELMARLWRNVGALYERLEGLGLELCAPPSPILSVRLADREGAIRAWNDLMEQGVYVNLAIPPGTPKGVSLLRCSVSAAHSEQQIAAIGDAFARIGGTAEQAA